MPTVLIPIFLKPVIMGMPSLGVQGVSFLFILFLLFSTGCTAPTIPVEETSVEVEISLEQAIGTMIALDDIEAIVPPRQIYYVKGTGITINGTAEEWALGVKQGNETFFFVFNKWGQSKVPWTGPLPEEEIIIDHFLYPDELFKDRPLLIQDLTEGGTRRIDELELRSGVYTLTIRTDTGLKEHRFYARTGIEL